MPGSHRWLSPGLDQRGLGFRGLKCEPHDLSSESSRIVLINGVARQSDRLDAGCGMTIPADDLVQVMQRGSVVELNRRQVIR
jgi:hypothetical protein